MESKLILLISTFLSLTLLQSILSVSATTLIRTDDIDGSPKKSTSLLLSRILEDPEQTRELVRLLEAIEARRRVGESIHGARDSSDETRKREAAWDMDYGWGGGRFGKRMDSLGMAGRFGRSVERAAAAPRAKN